MPENQNKIDRYLKTALAHRASDLHITSGEPVRVRVDGDLVPLEEGPIAASTVTALLKEMLTPEEWERFASKRNLDKSYTLSGEGNFRVNIFKTKKGMAAVLRAIPHKVPTLHELGLPDSLTKLTEAGQGLVLVTGPTGSGKSTTLASLVDYINQNFAYHILTAEDPIEFVHDSKRSLVNQREIGNHCPTFAEALKYALREDPDVILVGEMRDLETISLALTAAETGHLVFGTLHTRGAAASVDRIIDSFPANQQAMIRTMLAESLSAVVSQSLLKKADGPGRVAAYEILIVNHAISNLIREGKTFQIPTSIQTGRKEGMILMDQSIMDLVQRGTVAPEEALAYVTNPEILKPHLNKRPTPAVSVPKAPEVVPRVIKPAPLAEIKSPVEAIRTNSHEYIEAEPTDITSLSELENAEPEETVLPERRLEEETRSLPVREEGKKTPPPPPPFPKRKVG